MKNSLQSLVFNPSSVTDKERLDRVYKTINKIGDIKVSLTLSNNNRIRDHTYKLVKQRSHLYRYLIELSINGTTLFLPSHVVEVDHHSLSLFKSRLDSHWIWTIIKAIGLLTIAIVKCPLCYYVSYYYYYYHSTMIHCEI